MRIFIFVLIVLPFFVSAQAPSSIAFYYNSIDSVRELMNYERVVVSPNLITPKQIDTLKQANTDVFAYLSVGEFDGPSLPNNLRTSSPAKNENWQSYAMDLTSPDWQLYLTKQSKSYLAKGFDGLFLDTLDSYYLFADNETEQRKQQQALVGIIAGLNQLAGEPKLILNRGFEIVGQLEQPISAVLAESLYNSYHPVDNSYHKVKPSDSEWLANKLDQVKERGIETIVIDYIPSRDREAQRAAARRLLNEGYTPYVSDGLLYEFGVSTIEPIAKRVLGFFDGRYTDFSSSECHRMISMPIEYKGYVPECRNIRTTNFANVDLSRYAAIVLWLDEVSYQGNAQLLQWLSRAIDERPILFIKSLPTDETLRKKLGISDVGELEGEINVSSGADWLANRYPPTFSQFESYQRWVASNSRIHALIKVTDQTGNTSGLLFKAPWGGAILSPLPVSNLANNTEAWTIDPFRLIEETLDLPKIPAADATTESGRRILTSHIDGDGFPSKAWFPGKPYTAEVLLKHVFKKYPLPQTVSVIEGEVGKRGLYPEQSDEMEAVARKIFALPNVEIASHTFSHPFFWDLSKAAKKKQYGDHLPIPGYTLDYRNEIIGSVDYINNTLAPEGKKVKLILWSGKADPKEDVLAIAEEAKLLNVNGGNTYVVNGNNNYTQISPTIAWYPSAVHVYTPVLNENLYTNLWSEHHDGYGRAVETFELLGSPRRLKSIAIYYHMYTGAYPASLKAVINVYDWALEQNTTPLYLSEYAKRARTLYETGIAKTLDGKWQITSSGIKSIRLPNSFGYPVIKQSNIAGWNDGPDGKYLTLSSPRSIVMLSAVPKKQSAYLKNANGQLVKWETVGAVTNWVIESHVPLVFEIANGSKCKLTSDSVLKRTVITNGGVRYTASKAGTFSGSLRCSSQKNKTKKRTTDG